LEDAFGHFTEVGDGSVAFRSARWDYRIHHSGAHSLMQVQTQIAALEAERAALPDAAGRSAHRVYTVAVGAWTNCRGQDCGTFRLDAASFQEWFLAQMGGGTQTANTTTLLFRDPLPQHFPSLDGRYDGAAYERDRDDTDGHCQELQNQAPSGCVALASGAASGSQACKLNPGFSKEQRRAFRFAEGALPDTVIADLPARGLRRLPVWGLTARMHGMHNNRQRDCTHFCTALSSIWNLMAVHLVIQQTRGVDVADQNGGARIADLIRESHATTAHDLAAFARQRDQQEADEADASWLHYFAEYWQK
jgi:hypothetical protein